MMKMGDATSGTVTAKALRACVMVAAKRGVGAEELLAPLGVEMSALEDVDAHVPIAWIDRAWTDAPVLSGDPDFGLHAAELATAAPSHVVDYFAASCRHPREFFELLIRFQRVLSSSNDIRLEIEDGVAAISRHGETATQFIVFVVAQFVLIIRRRSGSALPLRRATFRHAAPASTKEYERVFGCPVVFEAARDGIELDAAVLDRELPGADPHLLAVLQRHAGTLLAAMPSAPAGSADQVRRHLLGLPPAATPTIEDVAKALGVSTRSLQRQLREEGATFKGVLEETRRDLSLAYLRERQHSVSEVAFLTGFAEVSAFSRAFRRWTGTSPAGWRRANLAREA